MYRRTVYVSALLVVLGAGAYWLGTRPTATDKALRSGDTALAAIHPPADFHRDGSLSKADADGRLTWFRSYHVDNQNATDALAEYAKALTDAGAIPAEPAVCGGSIACVAVYYPPHTYQYEIVAQTGPDVERDTGSYITVNMTRR
jgi:hypothetical protein